MFECLLEDFNYRNFIDEIFLKIEGGERELASSKIMQTPGRANSFGEIEFLKAGFSPGIVSSISRQGLQGWYALSFCLRFHVAWLNYFFSSKQDKSLVRDLHGWSNFFEFSKINESHYFEYLDKKLNSFYLDLLPLIGFSALGLHIKRQKYGRCRAFDRDLIATCRQEVEGTLCAHHSSEAWWLNSSSDNRSTQAVMYQFYADPENFYCYSKRELEEINQKFWNKIRSYREVNEDDIKRSLKVFGLLNQEDVLKLGVVGFRKLFLKKSLECHPDLGGTPDKFISLKKSFEVLKTIFD